MSTRENPHSNEATMIAIAAGVVTILTLLVGFGLLIADVSYFWVAFPVGFGGVLPLTIGLMRLFRRRSQTTNQTSEDDPINTLRERYASGELTDEAFENQVEKLVETESDGDRPDFSHSEREVEREK